MPNDTKQQQQGEKKEKDDEDGKENKTKKMRKQTCLSRTKLDLSSLLPVDPDEESDAGGIIIRSRSNSRWNNFVPGSPSFTMIVFSLSLDKKEGITKKKGERNEREKRKMF